MAHTAQRARLNPDRLRAIQAVLRERNLDGWLLYDFHGVNPIANRVLGLSYPMSRRFFVLIPADGRPVVVAHRLERQPWSDWPGTIRPYLTWEELEQALRETLTPGSRIALETSEMNRVPQVDRVPAGVLELIESAGVHVSGSSELVTLFASAWSQPELGSHRKVAAMLAQAAEQAFRRAATGVADGEQLSEWTLKAEILENLNAVGLVDADTIVAVGPNSADGHYEPTASSSSPLQTDRVLLIDLWGREPNSVFADQTWMGYLGEDVPEKVERVWQSVRAARDAAIDHIRDHFADEDPPLKAADVDRASRSIIEEAGFGEFFIHRTGHSIDSDLHGFGPNIDSVESKDERRLLPGIGFSIEPGVYLKGEFGLRSEVNVYLGEDGPEVTTPHPQDEVYRLLDEAWLNSNGL